MESKLGVGETEDMGDGEQCEKGVGLMNGLQVPQAAGLLGVVAHEN